jgi:superfamily II DNA or RNA helicase
VAFLGIRLRGNPVEPAKEDANEHMSIQNTKRGDLDVPCLPRIGMLATVRNRRAIVASVEPFDSSTEGRVHLVRLEYTDLDGVPEDTVIWEREHAPQLLEPTALPRVGDELPMPPADFDALVRAARWSAMTPFVVPEGCKVDSGSVLAAPLFGAIQTEDFQLVPVLKALQMPRVSLLLADDVGLGKTIEAGLVLSELIIKRRIRRVLILCPAALKNQWKQEMEEKFALRFDVIDREETHELQKRLGLDANPWRTFPRIVSSYHYLRQPDILEQFHAASKQQEGLAQLPWDLLIVDEAHNLSPSNFGDDSDLSKMLRTISPWFEHKLFLTATPHNGHTRCFSGLLEQLDPVRFTQTAEFTPQEKDQVSQCVVRRLKSEINNLDDSLRRPRRFAERYLEPVPLYLGPLEKRLALAFADLRTAIRRAVAMASKGEQLAGSFAIEVLNKRLLSCPATFAESWMRLKEGLATGEKAQAAEVAAAHRAAEVDLDDDQEKESRALHAARTIGSWLKPMAARLQPEILSVDSALNALGLSSADSLPKEDERYARLKTLIQQRLRTGNQWGKDERLIVFTEYKTTLDYLERRLKKDLADDGTAIRVLFGGMPMKAGKKSEAPNREEIKAAFNDPDDPIRVLLATDAASEGLNLQETARLLLHFDIPWNPSRMEQRNGRLDRHGQARDVTVFHFTSDSDADLKFLAHVVQKAHTIREDLGSMGEIFDAAFQRRFIDLEDERTITSALDHDVETTKGKTKIPRTEKLIAAEDVRKVEEFCREIDLSPDSLWNTLDVALGIGFGQPRLEGPDPAGRYKFVFPLPPRWESLIDDTVRIQSDGQLGRMPKIIFDPKLFVTNVGGRPIFRPTKDTRLFHLGHPLFRHALAAFARARFPGGREGQTASRWLVRTGQVPPDAEALLLLTIEELAINELREPFHHWVHTLRLPIRGGALGPPLPHIPAAADRPTVNANADSEFQRAIKIWDDVRLDVSDFLSSYAVQLSRRINERLDRIRTEEFAANRSRFEARVSEVRKLMRENSVRKLEKERDQLLAERRQKNLFEPLNRDLEERLRNLEEELQKRQGAYQELLGRLDEEQKRVLERLLPKRYQLRDEARVFPVTIEIRMPEVRQ